MRQQLVHLGLKQGDGLALRVERALLFRLVLDQLPDGHFGGDLFLLPEFPKFLGWYGGHEENSFTDRLFVRQLPHKKSIIL